MNNDKTKISNLKVLSNDYGHILLNKTQFAKYFCSSWTSRVYNNLIEDGYILKEEDELERLKVDGSSAYISIHTLRRIERGYKDNEVIFRAR